MHDSVCFDLDAAAPDNPLTADPGIIFDGKVDMTFLAGTVVYSR